jgi:hypothetical protein
MIERYVQVTRRHARCGLVAISFLFALGTISFVAPMPDALAQGLGTQSQPNTFADRLTYSRAVEAAIWARPLTGFKALMDGLQRDAGVGYNDIGYFSKVQNSKLKWPTANATTPYVVGYWNAEKDAAVVEIPPATPDVSVFGLLADAWQRPIADVGPDGVDGGRGAKYLLTTSEYRGPAPPGYILLQQTTYNGYMALRLVLKDNSAASLQKAAEYVKRVKIFPLSQVDNPQTRYIDLYDKKVNLVSRLDADMYRTLDTIIQTERIEERDLVAMGMLQSLGIEKGKPFAPSDKMVAMFGAAAKETQHYLRQGYLTDLPIYYSGTQWRVALAPGVLETRFTYLDPGYVDTDNRGFQYNFAWGSGERVGKATFYINLAADVKGQPLDGSRNFRLKVPANAPVTQFWSATIQSDENGAFMDVSGRVALASTDEGVVKNPDGSVDVYFGPNAPQGHEGNWVQTVPDKRWFIMFRFYGTQPAVFDKSWRMGDIETLN